MIVPKKLQSGDEIRVIAPARSLSVLSEDNLGLFIVERLIGVMI